ncbi:MAG: hypothetical protein WBB85_14500 [Albidovulum sp.]|uniref:hypothetical protein n=1 Tax=Albidovulum sp. TaxID=1872424 RepID=UPI003C83EF29
MTTESYEILVHAGAHCCEAEDVQRFVGVNRDAIDAAGYDLAYPGRGGAPGGHFDFAFPEPRHTGLGAEVFSSRMVDAIPVPEDGRRGLILSEHDLAGRMASLLNGRFYPAARSRAEVLRSALGRPVDHVIFTVAPYDALFVGAWRRFALDRLVEPFAEYATAMASFSGGWVEVVEALRDGLEARKVTILATRPHPMEVLAHLAPGLRLTDPVMPAAAPRVTDSAVAMIQRHYRQGARFAPGQRDRILAFHARQPQTGIEQGFPGLQLADLRGRYVADLDTLARLPGVELVGAAMPAVAAE